MRIIHLFLTAAVLGGGAASIVRGQAPAESDFTLTLTPYAWLSGVNGDVTVRGRESSTDACFTEILDASDSLLGLAARVEARKGRVGGYVDVVYNRIGVDDLAPRLGGLDVVMDQWFVDFGLIYRLGEWPIGDAGDDRRVSVDLTAGARYISMEIDVDRIVGGSRESNRDWIDPVVGAIVRADLDRNVSLELRGDIGGFGVESDLAWSAAALIAWQFDLGDTDAAFFAGYKAIGNDYSDGSGNREFGWDAVVHGPMLGMSFTL